MRSRSAGLLSVIQAPIPFLLGTNARNLAFLGDGPDGMALGDERISSLMLARSRAEREPMGGLPFRTGAKVRDSSS